MTFRRGFGYADIAPHRDAAWLGTIINGLGFAVVGVALGLAVCMLAPRRGSIWANVGAVVAGPDEPMTLQFFTFYGRKRWFENLSAGAHQFFAEYRLEGVEVIREEVTLSTPDKAGEET